MGNLMIEKNKSFSEPVIIEHDTIRYSFKDLPDEKYYNWEKMASPVGNTEDFTAWGYPYILHIEPTSLCNLRCPLCACGQKKLNRPYRHMTLDEYRPIIDDVSQYLMLAVLWDWGEPLMNPAFPSMVRYASERDIKTVTSTNAHYLNDDKYLAEVLTSGLTTMIVAIDSLKQTDYAAYRQKGSIDKAISGLEKAVKMKKELGSDTTIVLRMMIMKSNENELDEMKNFARATKVDIFSVKTVNPTCGLTSSGDEFLPENPKYRRYKYKQGTNEPIRIVDNKCWNIWHMSDIFSNGDVVACGNDFEAKNKLGNVFKTPFSKIWKSRAYSELRKRVYLNKDEFIRCRECAQSFQNSDAGWFPEFLDLAAERARKENST